MSAGGSAAPGSCSEALNQVRGSTTVTEGAKELQTDAENEIALRKEQAIASGVPNYKNPSKPAETMDKVLAILKTEFTKRDALKAVMARDMVKTTQR